MTPGCTATSIELGESRTLPVRVYGTSSARRAPPLVLHLHGGAFCRGAFDEALPGAGATVPELLAAAGAVVVSADYPLAPRHPFPQALRTIFGALVSLQKGRARWAGRMSRLFVAGEEAGGNLAASLALIARDQQAPKLDGQILLSPMLDPCLATRSVRGADAGPAGCRWADGWQRYLGSPQTAAHPYAAPSQSSRLSGLPPALVVTAEDDPMRDESLSYAARLQESGVEVRQHVLPAPTSWPEALCVARRSQAGWPAVLLGQFIQFFADRAATLRRPASRSVFQS